MSCPLWSDWRAARSLLVMLAETATRIEMRGGSRKGTPPSPDTRIATAPASSGVGKTRPRPRLAGSTVRSTTTQRSAPRHPTAWRRWLARAGRPGRQGSPIPCIRHRPQYRVRFVTSDGSRGSRCRCRGESARVIHSRVRGVLRGCRGSPGAAWRWMTICWREPPQGDPGWTTRRSILSSS
jgi:hypothetical protein